MGLSLSRCYNLYVPLYPTVITVEKALQLIDAGVGTGGSTETTFDPVRASVEVGVRREALLGKWKIRVTYGVNRC